jgi:phosphatidylglycerol lysyltransferase
VNFVERQGIRLQEWKPEDMDAAEWDRRIQLLTDVSDQHLAGKPQKESIPFFECELIPGYTFRRRVFVAVHPDNPDHVEAFVLCNPIADGREWAIEMYRQRTDAVRGAIPFMMSQVIDQLQAEGCRQVSICPVPTIGCEERLPGDCTVVQKSLLLWRKYLSSFFDIKGLYHFKSRFRPDMHPIHVCAYPRSSFLAMLAYMELVRMSNVKPLHVLKNLLFGDSQRRTLSKPDKNPAPVVRPAVASHPVVSKSTSRSGVTTS